MTRNSRLQPGVDYGRRVEDEIAAGPPERVALAAALMWDAEVEDDEIVPRFMRCVGSLADPCWAHGVHEGDCTKVATTCFRCLIEGDWDRAGRIIESARPPTCPRCKGTGIIWTGTFSPNHASSIGVTCSCSARMVAINMPPEPVIQLDHMST